VKTLFNKTLTFGTLLGAALGIAGFSSCEKKDGEPVVKERTKSKKTTVNKTKKRVSKAKKADSDDDDDDDNDNIAFLDNLSTEKALKAQEEIARLIAMLQEENKTLIEKQEATEQPYQTVLFEPGSFELGNEQHVLVNSSLEKIVAAAMAGKTIVIRGHSDPLESNYNDAEALALAQKRAEAVKQEMISAGVPQANIEVAAIGKDELIVYNFDEKQQELSSPNRRVEILTI